MQTRQAWLFEVSLESDDERANRIVNEIRGGGKPTGSTLYCIGVRIQERSQDPTLPQGVRDILGRAGANDITRGVEQWASSLVNEVKKSMPAKGKGGRSGQNAGQNQLAAAVRKRIASMNLPDEVRRRIESLLSQAPAKAKGGKHPGTMGAGARKQSGRGAGKSTHRESEFLFEMPFLLGTPNVSTYSSPELQEGAYYSNISPEQQSQWLFEAPYILPEVDWFTGSKNISNLLLVNAKDDKNLDFPGVYSITWKDHNGKAHSYVGRAGVDLKSGRRTTGETVRSRLNSHYTSWRKAVDLVDLNSRRVSVQLLTNVKKTTSGERAKPSKEQRVLVSKAERKLFDKAQKRHCKGKVVNHNDPKARPGIARELESGDSSLFSFQIWE